MDERLPARRLIARDAEVQTVHDLVGLGGQPLVTLTGAGGTGKTSIALTVAAQLGNETPDGVWIVDLIAETDSTSLAHACCMAIGLADQDREPAEVLAHHLEARQALLVLDNCEHLAAGVADLTEVLLARCPYLRVLATSRTPLGAAGEVVFAVPPLAVPSLRAAPQTIANSPSVQLFVTRARAAASTFELSPDNAADVAAICRRLAGLPLAIELAAGWVTTLTPHEIAERLPLRDLGSPRRRGGAAHQQTMQATLDWSLALLGEAERVLFRRLAVFADGWTLDACAGVVGPIADDESSIAGLLRSLVDHSLVVAETGAAASRYRLLEPIREHARAQLEAAGEHADCSLAHARLYLGLVAQRAHPFPHLTPAEADRIAAVHDNCLAALRWAGSAGRADLVGGLVSAMMDFWRSRGFLRLGIPQLRAALALTGLEPAQRAPILLLLTNLETLAGGLASADAHAREGLALFTAAGLTRGRRIALGMMGDVAAERGELATALERYEEARALIEPDGSETSWAFYYANTGSFLLRAGRPAEARDRLEQARRRFEALPPVWYSGRVLGQLGRLARAGGDVDEADRLLRDGLAWLGQYGSVLEAIPILEELARLALDRGDPERAATLFAAAVGLRDDEGISLSADAAQQLGADLDRTRAELPRRRFAHAWAAGRELTLAAALDLVAKPEVASVAARRLGRAPRGSQLTPREQEVARLVAQGLTNSEAAEQLAIATGTVRIHVERILSKLGLTSRVQIATWVVGSRRSGTPLARHAVDPRTVRMPAETSDAELQGTRGRDAPSVSVE